MEAVSIGAVAFLAYIIAQRLIELVIAKRNTAALIAQGAQEHFPRHYPLIVAVHAGWIAAMVVFGHDNPLNLAWLAVYAVLQLVRVYILTSLGHRWTTRIIVLPDAPLVKRGAYARLPHPNYLLVIAEIFVAPMVLGLVGVAAVFSMLNAAILVVRVSAEESVLRR